MGEILPPLVSALSAYVEYSNIVFLYVLIYPGVRDPKEPCYDTSTLHWDDFSDWTHCNVTLERMLRFIALQAHVIHHEDPKVSFHYDCHFTRLSLNLFNLSLNNVIELNSASLLVEIISQNMGCHIKELLENGLMTVFEQKRHLG